jgi:hypothetical protein
MSKLKTPREKKLASLALDNRNVYGENAKASRKAIPLRKQLSHQSLRRAAKQPLAAMGAIDRHDEDAVVDLESTLLSDELQADRGRFRKRPDETLGAVLSAKTIGNRAAFKRIRK